jgi:hypothetical protein
LEALVNRLVPYDFPEGLHKVAPLKRSSVPRTSLRVMYIRLHEHFVVSCKRMSYEIENLKWMFVCDREREINCSC